MTDKQPPIELDRARELLARERERVETALSDQDRVLRSELAEIGAESDPQDAGEQIEEGEVDQALAENLRRELAAIERAEQRLEKGSYGFSVESGEPIPAKRLEAIPWAERTPSEQEHFERTHGRPW